jgi:chromosome segregation ATPase
MAVRHAEQLVRQLDDYRQEHQQMMAAADARLAVSAQEHTRAQQELMHVSQQLSLQAQSHAAAMAQANSEAVQRESTLLHALTTVETTLDNLRQDLATCGQDREVLCRQRDEVRQELATATQDVLDLKEILRVSVSKEHKAVAVVTELSAVIQSLQQQLRTAQTAYASDRDAWLQTQERTTQQLHDVEHQLAQAAVSPAAAAALHHQVRDTQQQVAELQTALDASQAKKVELVTALKDAQTLVQEQDATVQRWKRKAEDAERQAQESQTLLVKTHDALKVKEAQLTDHTDTIQTLKTQLRTSTQHAQQHQTEVAHVQQELEVLRRERDDLKHQLDEAFERETGLQDKWQNSAAEQEHADALVEELRAQLAEARGELDQAHTRHATAETEWSARLALVDTIEHDVADMRATWTATETGLRARIAQLEGEVHAVQQTAQQATRRAQEETKEANQRIQTLQGLCDEANARVQTTEDEMRILLREIDRQKAAAVQFARVFSAGVV